MSDDGDCCYPVGGYTKPTPSPLTREQVCELVRIVRLAPQGSLERPHAARKLIDSDAALRLTLTQQAQEIERLKNEKVALSESAAKLVGQCCEKHLEEVRRMGFPEFVATHPKGCEWCLQQQLAAMTMERDEACGELLVSLDDAPIGSLAGKLVTANRVLRSQLATAQARVRELEEALELLYDHQNGCPLPKYESEWNLATQLAQKALKRTP